MFIDEEEGEEGVPAALNVDQIAIRRVDITPDHLVVVLVSALTIVDLQIAAREGDRKMTLKVTSAQNANEVAVPIPLDLLSSDLSWIRTEFFDLWASTRPGKRTRVTLPDHIVLRSLKWKEREIGLFRTRHGNASLRNSPALGLPPRSGRSGLRIMIFVNQINLSGGKTKAMFKLAEQFSSNGHEVCLTALYYGNNESKHAFPKGVAFDFVDGSFKADQKERDSIPSPLEVINKRSTQLTVPRLATLLAGSDYDFIYLPNYDSVIYDTFARHLPKRTVVVLGDHNPHRLKQFDNNAVNPFFEEASRWVDGVHFVNPLLLPGARKITDKHVFYIPNTAEAKTPIARDDRYFAVRRVIAIGRLNGTKRMNHVISAFEAVAAEFPEWSLDIYGGGAKEEALLKQIAATNLSRRIRLVGFDPDVRGQLAKGAIYITATAAEALPLTMIEAMEAGCLMVSYDAHMGARFLIKDGESGLLASDGNVKALSKALAKAMRMIENRDTTVLSMLSAALDRIPEFSDDRVSKLWDEKVKELVSAKRGAT